MLEACKTCGSLIERVVIASSDKAYGSHDVLPYREGAPLQGRYPYDVSKSCADLLSLSYFYTYGVPLAITRCGNLFGGGDLSFNRLIPGTIRSAFQNQAPVIRSDGKFVRDYFFVKDAVKAYVLLAEQLPNCNFVGQAFNFGPERPMSVLEIVQLILKLMDKQELAPVILNQATLEIYRQYLDCSKARQMLSWEPQFTLEDGLTQTISWYKHYFENT